MKHMEIALEAWRQCEQLRSRRKRCKDFTFGRQWNDKVTDSSGNTVTEGELTEMIGRKPLTNNLIRQLVKCVVGNFRVALDEADPAMDEVPVNEATARRNSLMELDCRMLEEFIISGCAVQRVVAERRLHGDGVWVDNVSPDSFFVNRFYDPRGHDIELIGMLHSMSLREILMRFAPEGGRRATHLTACYSRSQSVSDAVFIGDDISRRFFETESGRCRVIELWTLESRSVLRCHDHASGQYFLVPSGQEKLLGKEASRRTESKIPVIEWCPSTTLRWHCRFLTPTGEILQEFDSPYAHGSHPFAVKFYPLIDGEVHSLVEDIIDQQRYVNRLITLVDHVMSVSAKGALLVPQDCIPPGWSFKELGRLWAQPNSIIPYIPNNGEPKQLVGGSENSSAYRMLDMQMDLFHRISGVNDVLQGKVGSTHSSAALFDSQVERSAVAILDLMRTFNDFRLHRNELIAAT